MKCYETCPRKCSEAHQNLPCNTFLHSFHKTSPYMTRERSYIQVTKEDYYEANTLATLQQ